jgi:multiple sugar transport system substrate-binding protein
VASARKVALGFLILLVLFIPGCTKKPEGGVTTIRFVTWKPNQPEVWDEIIGNFEKKHPHIKVEREIGPHSSTAFHDLLTQKLKNRSKDVDVFFLDVTWPPEFASAGWALPLDGRFPPSEREKFLAGPVMADTYKGNIYGIPLFVDAGMLFYRKDLLKKYRFAPPRTWPEMVAQAKAVVAGEKRQDREIAGFSGQFKQYEGLVCNMLEYVLSNGGHILNPQTGKSALAEKPAVEAVRFVRDGIIGSLAPLGVLTYQEPESLDLFVQGGAVFHRNWPYAWEVSNNPQKSAIAGNVGIAKLPAFPGGMSHSTLGGWQLGISAFSEKQDTAWEFVQFVTGEETQRLIALKANPQFADMREVFIAAYPRPRTPLYPTVSNILQRYFSKTISDAGADIEREAKSASAEIDRMLALIK